MALVRSISVTVLFSSLILRAFWNTLTWTLAPANGVNVKLVVSPERLPSKSPRLPTVWLIAYSVT